MRSVILKKICIVIILIITIFLNNYAYGWTKPDVIEIEDPALKKDPVTNQLATEVTESEDWVGGAQTFMDSGKNEDIGINKDKLKKASDGIYNMLSSIGMIISVIVGLILGIIFMVSSANDKAKVKEALLPYIIGSLVIFGAFGIWKLIINTFNI